MHTATVRFDLTTEPPAETLTRCAFCAARPAGTMSATPAMVAAAQPGALRVGDALCDTCGDALVEDVVTLRREQREADAAEELLLIALQECSCEAWKLWGRTATGPTPRHAATVRVLERDTGRGVDGFVAFGGAL